MTRLLAAVLLVAVSQNSDAAAAAKNVMWYDRPPD